MSILLTGGAGFIGSHTAVEMLQAGYGVVIADNLVNSSEKVLDRIEMIAGRRAAFYRIDVANKADVSRIFDEHEIDGVVHFAGFKSVPESTRIPLAYYRNNLDTAMTVLEAMEEKNCKAFVFSSSATVYGERNAVPFDETMPTGEAANAYGSTKLMIENILEDYARAQPDFSVVLLRYFNPVGAHPSGLIGEAPNGIPNNLMPYIAQTAVGTRERLHVFGTDYDTHDGTGVRDYIHVVDLARGHVAAVQYACEHTGIEAINLGSGQGHSVLDVVRAFEKASGAKIPLVYDERRPGDVAVSYAAVEKAKRLLHWETEYSLQDMCAHSWNWQNKNPNGYENEKTNQHTATGACIPRRSHTEQ